MRCPGPQRSIIATSTSPGTTSRSFFIPL
jgi:hypothetical protein